MTTAKGCYLNRRTFIERLGLGAGLTVLTPMLTILEKEARGAVSLRKRFIVVTYSNGGYMYRVVPPEFTGKSVFNSAASGTSFTIPAALRPLEALRDRLLLIDGLSNRGAGGHFAWNLLTGVPNQGERLGGKSIDEHIAAGPVGRGALFPAVHLGSSTGEDGRANINSKFCSHMSAKSAGNPVSIMLQPADALRQLFPAGTTGATPGARAGLGQKRRLLDWLNDDIKRARSRLAGPERVKLDQYMNAIEMAQSRVDKLEQVSAAGGSCGPAALATPRTPVQADDLFEAQMQIGSAALTCGLTNVLTVGFVGIGFCFSKRLDLGGIALHGYGHGKSMPGHDNEYGTRQYMDWFAQQVVKLARELSAVREGDRTIFDQSAILFANDNAESHHSRGFRWPVSLIGNAGGALRADGRFFRAPALGAATPAPDGPAGLRSVADLNATLARAFDAPADDWGTGGVELVKGPIAELLA